MSKEIQLENIKKSNLKGFPTFVITDIESLELPKNIIVLQLPKAKHDLFNSAFQHLGFDMVVGYIRKYRDVISFCADDPIFKNDIVKGRLKETVLVI